MGPAVGRLTDGLARWTHRAAFLVAARRAVRRLAQDDTDGARTIADAVNRVLTDTIDSVSREWFERIERLRSDLTCDVSTVVYVDYGSGSRTAAQAGALRRDHELDAAAAPPAPATVQRRVNALARSSAPRHEAAVLHSLVRSARSVSCLELGTCLGISAAYLGSAAHVNGDGRVVSIEGGAAVAERARANLTSLGLSNVIVETGTFDTALPEVMKTHEPFDFAFLDGHHDPDATLRYWHLLKPSLSPRALVVVDDIAWSTGMRKAWRQLRVDPSVAVAADLLTFGICSVDKT